MNPTIIIGLLFGDETKGRTVDEHARRVSGPVLVVRHNGGPQAIHNVVAPDNTWHPFAQIGAASLQPGVRTALSRFMLVNLPALSAEARMLKDRTGLDPSPWLFVDPRCVLITPMHVCLGQAREVLKRRGSCGQGVGEAARDAEQGLSLCVQDLLDGIEGYAKLEALYAHKREQVTRLLASTDDEEVHMYHRAFCELIDIEQLFVEYRGLVEQLVVAPTEKVIREALRRNETVLFEGAQGTLLHREHGFLPHVTQSDPTATNARTLLKEAWFEGTETVIGVLRAYATRHGAGPFVSEAPETVGVLIDPHNFANGWQGPFRTGWIDFPALRYAIRLNGKVDELALSCLDQLSGLESIPMCVGYEHPELGTMRNIPDLDPENRTRIMFECKPVLVELPGWGESLSSMRSWGDLPRAARRYVDHIEHELGIRIKTIGVGAHSDQTIYR